MFQLVRTVHGYLCSPSSVIAATVPSCAGFKTAQFSYLHATFYLQRVELCRQKVVQNVASGPAFKCLFPLPYYPLTIDILMRLTLRFFFIFICLFIYLFFFFLCEIQTYEQKPFVLPLKCTMHCQ